MKVLKKRKQWSPEEKALLLRLYPKYISKKWKKISQQFRKKGFRRKQVEIRDRWINFYDPSVNKSEWKLQQLKLIYDSYDVHGTKWCRMQNIIGRTQNMIKNRFYGTMRNYVRFILKNSEIHSIQYLKKISKLSPKIFGDIYSSQNNFQFLNNESRTAIISMNYLLNQTILTDRINKQKKLYDQLAVKIIQQINEIMSFQDQNDFQSQRQNVKKKVIVKQPQNSSQSQYDDTSFHQQKPQFSQINQGIKVEQKVKIEEIILKKQQNEEDMIRPHNYYPFLDPKEYRNGLYSYQLFIPFEQLPGI